MDAIKKKMLAMKLEKENATDRADQGELTLKEQQEKYSKLEEDFDNLQKKNEPN